MKAFSIICVISILLLAGCGKSKKQQETTPTPSVAVDHPQLRTVVYTFEYPGYLQAEQTVNLVARVSGYLESYQFTPGQRVSEGQTLFVIEPQPYKDKVTQAEANVESSKSKLAYTKASYERMQEAGPEPVKSGQYRPFILYRESTFYRANLPEHGRSGQYGRNRCQ